MRKKAKSNYDRFVDALIDAADKHLFDPHNRLTYSEFVGGLYAFVRISENYASEIIHKEIEGENDE